MTETAVANTPQKVAAFVECFKTHSMQTFIANLTTEIEQLDIGGIVFPISINAGNLRKNCYICDPITGYVDYALDETRNFFEHPILRTVVKSIISVSAPMVRMTGLDNIVIVNNWLLSTNPVPRLSSQIAAELVNRLTEKYPDKIIAMRSLNTIADPHSISVLKAQGFRMLPSRQVYIFSDNNRKQDLSSNMRFDKKLLRKTSYSRVANDQFHESDYQRCIDLYNMLYLVKYTPLNPQYTECYLRYMHQKGLIELEGLRDRNGILVAVTGLFANGNTLTQPIVGYDTSLPLREGLYRMVMAIGQNYASQNGLFFNMSAGAAEFKRYRRALPAIEFMAVYDRHLPRRQRASLQALETLLTKIGVPLLERFEL